MSEQPKFVLMGGPNGSGKSTLAERVVLGEFGIVRFMNADTIARGFAAYDVDVAAASAGRALLMEADRLVEARQDYATETTLSGRSWAKRIKQMNAAGYLTHLAFVYVDSPDRNVDRVAYRVAHGGHHIPEDDIRRRYERSLSNLFKVYLPIVSSWKIYNNTSTDGHRAVAAKGDGGDIDIFDPVEWERLRSSHA